MIHHGNSLRRWISSWYICVVVLFICCELYTASVPLTVHRDYDSLRLSDSHTPQSSEEIELALSQWHTLVASSDTTYTLDVLFDEGSNSRLFVIITGDDQNLPLSIIYSVAKRIFRCTNNLVDDGSYIRPLTHHNSSQRCEGSRQFPVYFPHIIHASGGRDFIIGINPQHFVVYNGLDAAPAQRDKRIILATERLIFQSPLDLRTLLLTADTPVANQSLIMTIQVTADNRVQLDFTVRYDEKSAWRVVLGDMVTSVVPGIPVFKCNRVNETKDLIGARLSDLGVSTMMCHVRFGPRHWMSVLVNPLYYEAPPLVDAIPPFAYLGPKRTCNVDVETCQPGVSCRYPCVMDRPLDDYSWDLAKKTTFKLFSKPFENHIDFFSKVLKNGVYFDLVPLLSGTMVFSHLDSKKNLVKAFKTLERKHFFRTKLSKPLNSVIREDFERMVVNAFGNDHCADRGIPLLFERKGQMIQTVRLKATEIACYYIRMMFLVLPTVSWADYFGLAAIGFYQNNRTEITTPISANWSLNDIASPIGYDVRNLIPYSAGVLRVPEKLGTFVLHLAYLAFAPDKRDEKRIVTFTRGKVGEYYKTNKLYESKSPFPHFKVHNTGVKADDLPRIIRQDFADKESGGFLFTSEMLQEEILMLTSPDAMMVIPMVTPISQYEAVSITGADRKFSYKGYDSSFQLLERLPPRDAESFGMDHLMCVDATVGNHGHDARDISKIFAGTYLTLISSPDTSFLEGVSIGPWGCGAFGHDFHRKILEQYIGVTLALQEYNAASGKELRLSVDIIPFSPGFKSNLDVRALEAIVDHFNTGELSRALFRSPEGRQRNFRSFLGVCLWLVQSYGRNHVKCR